MCDETGHQPFANGASGHSEVGIQAMLATALREAIAPYRDYGDAALRDIASSGRGDLSAPEAARILKARQALAVAAEAHRDRLLRFGFPMGTATEAGAALGVGAYDPPG